jgi:RNA polymerase sigma-70 factor (ECF subfamily)
MRGDSFTALVEPHRRELRAHCYRMLGSFHEAEDLVQETFLRAWKKADSFEGRSSVRTWLYRIATNACLDFLEGRSGRVLPHDLTGPSEPGVGPPKEEIAWLEPYPGPDDAAIARETIELAFLAAIQHLPPRQRAVLILRDVVGWRAGEIAELLDGSVASVNSALQRARATLREHLPAHRLDWAPSTEPTQQERAVLRRYMDAVERADLPAVAALLAEDVRSTMPPYTEWFAGRAATLAALTESWNPASPAWIGRFRLAEVRANGQPAAAGWTSRDGEVFHATAIMVPVIRGDRIVEVTAFHDPDLFPAFGLPMSFPAAGRLPT